MPTLPKPPKTLLDLFRAAFQMPSGLTINGRSSTITNAFVNAIIPTVAPTSQEVEEALKILELRPDNVRCVYCADKATEWDHLRPIVRDRMPTGYVSEIANLVPACGKCNQSKGNKPWREWIKSDAEQSPAKRGLSGIAERMERLEKYEKWKTPQFVNFEALLGEDWAKYWVLRDGILKSMQDAQLAATRLKARIADGVRKKAQPVPPQVDVPSQVAKHLKDATDVE